MSVVMYLALQMEFIGVGKGDGLWECCTNDIYRVNKYT
jgi:hypothetical protein